MVHVTNIVSPCVSICALDEKSGLCKGCFRTIDEIASWPYLSDSDKIRIATELEKRRAIHDS